MKKEYVKPEIVFESFKMSTSIAGDCSLDATLADENSCEYKTDMGFKIFVSGCEYESADGDYGVCYHQPTFDTKVFAS